MKNQPFFLLLLSITTFCQQLQSSPDQIIELFRHGARSPVFILDDWAERGKLTPVGFRQHYILGKALAKKYPNLIQNAYKNNRLYMLTSNIQRCIESAGAHLHGLYSELDHSGITLRDNYPPELALPGFEDPYVKELAGTLPNREAIPYNFFPGVFNIADEVEMFVFAGDWNCPKMKSWVLGNTQDSFTENTLKEFEDTVTNLNKLLPDKSKLTSMHDLHAFADTMFADIYDNRTLKGDLNDPALITNITWAYTLNFYHMMQSQLQQRQLSSFHVIEALLEQLENFRKGEGYSIAALFSGHDNNLLAVLSAFGILNEGCIRENFRNVLETGQMKYPTCQFPSFASDFIIEFYNKTETPYVKVVYKNLDVMICNGKYECPYEDFIVFARNAMGNNTRETYYDKCRVDKIEEFQADSSPRSMIIQTCLNVILSILCIGLAYKLVGDRKKYVQLTNEAHEKQKQKTLYEEQESRLTDRSINILGI